MTAKVLTTNYQQYIKLQLDLQRAMYRNKTEPCPEKIKTLIEQIQEPASKLTGFEQKYADWVLDLYHPETGLDIKKLKTHIKEKALFDREYKNTHKDIQRKKATWEDLHKVLGWEAKEYLNTSQMCAIRAAMRGKLHMHKTLGEQREWVDHLVDHYRREA